MSGDTFKERVYNWWLDKTENHKWLFYIGIVIFGIIAIIVWAVPYIVEIIKADNSAQKK